MATQTAPTSIVSDGTTITSPSKRTRVHVDMQDDGSFVLVVDRDGHRVHYHSDNAEQAGPDGVPKSER